MQVIDSVGSTTCSRSRGRRDGFTWQKVSQRANIFLGEKSWVRKGAEQGVSVKPVPVCSVICT